jgi:hypothetical protein
MLDRLMADLIVVLHFVFIAFAIGGGLLVLRWRRVMYLHLPCVGWAVLVELMHWHCPLTRWENYFIDRYGAVGYDGGFLDHYLLPIIYPDGLTPAIQVGIGLFVLAVNVTVYGIVAAQARAHRRRRRLATAPTPSAAPSSDAVAGSGTSYSTT